MNKLARTDPNAPGLLSVERARAWLAEAVAVDEVKSLRDKAEAIASYQRKQTAGREAATDADLVVVFAERRIGELSRELPKAQGPGRGNKTSPTVGDVFGKGTALEKHGIKQQSASRYEAAAAIPEDEFERLAMTEAERGERVTLRHILTASASPDGSYDGDEWCTPAKYIELVREVLGEIDLDAASNDTAQKHIKAIRYFTKKNDALEQEWTGRVFLNPPYSYPLIEKFTAKFREEHDARRLSSGILLVNNSTDAEWSQTLLRRYAACFTNGRVPFEMGGKKFATRQGQVFYCCGNKDVVSRFCVEFSTVGTVMKAV